LLLEALLAVEGVYRLDADTTRALRVVDGKLTSMRSGGSPFELLPMDGDSFGFADSLSTLTIERGSDGKPVGMLFSPEGEGDGERWLLTDEPVTARAAIELSRADGDRLVGEYASPQLRMSVFFDDAGILHVQVPGQPAFALKAQTPTLLYITEVDASFEFTANPGLAETVTLLQGPARIVMRRQ
jgi:D-alanyl-D-alanine carboxypeptidase